MLTVVEAERPALSVAVSVRSKWNMSPWSGTVKLPPEPGTVMK